MHMCTVVLRSSVVCINMLKEGMAADFVIRWYMDCGYHGVRQEVATVVLPSNNRKINRRE
jgi:hypothetical protein